MPKITIYKPDGSKLNCETSTTTQDCDSDQEVDCDDMECECPNDGGIYVCIFSSSENNQEN